MVGEQSKPTRAVVQVPPGAGGMPNSAPFVEGWRRFVAEPLADWMRADLADLLGATAGLEDKVKRVCEALAQRPEDADAFRKAIGTQRKAKEAPPLENSVRMCGAMNAVWFTTLCKLGDVLDPKILPKDPATGLPQGSPQSLLPCVHRMRDAIAQDDTHYRDSALAAALIFDLLALNNQREPSAEMRLKVAGELERGFERASQTIRLGLALARRMKRLVLESDLPAVILMHEVGMAAAAAYVPGYADACRDWAKRQVSPVLRRQEEREKFGHAAAAFSEACGWLAPVLQEPSTVAGALALPFGLVDSPEADAADLACLAALAIELQSQPQLLKGTAAVHVTLLRPDLERLDFKFVPADVAKDAAGGAKKAGAA